ncbi:MAG: OmpA family protein [Desulfobulbaceae bacterium]|nr:OmpA family protein [Desulfobulbaceae bacterium]
MSTDEKQEVLSSEAEIREEQPLPPEPQVRRNRGNDYEVSHPVFVVDETFFRSRTPRATHWSIAWSDLMMTMFVLFLTLFVYQLAHREFISEETVEVVAGETMEVPPPSSSSSALPIIPIYPQVSEKKTDVVKKVERITVEEVKVDQFLQDIVIPIEDIPLPTDVAQEQVVAIPELDDLTQPAPLVESGTVIPADVIEQEDPASEEVITGEPPTDEELITEIYDLSKYTIESEKLKKFASVELIPDKTMRIILTGDLLFESGQAELTANARKSLYKLVPIIKQAPYMINIIGHTDSVPMSSPRYATNWELSTARASQVARFLIEDGNIPAGKFIVSWFSYFRPVKPNNTEKNRRANRRVEIILSKEPPAARPATSSSIN